MAEWFWNLYKRSLEERKKNDLYYNLIWSQNWASILTFVTHLRKENSEVGTGRNVSWKCWEEFKKWDRLILVGRESVCCVLETEKLKNQFWLIATKEDQELYKDKESAKGWEAKLCHINFQMEVHQSYFKRHKDLKWGRYRVIFFYFFFYIFWVRKLHKIVTTDKVRYP